MMSDNLRAALFMMVGSCAFAVNDTFLKLLGTGLGMFQIITLRGVAVSLIFAALLWVQRATISALRPRDRWFLALRSGAEMGAAFFFFKALFNMPLAAVTAIIQVVPLTVALAAYLFLKEPLGWRRLSAILMGLGGVMLIVRPGTETFTPASVYALLCVGMVTLRDLTTRVMAKGVPSSMVALTTAIGVTLMGATGSLSETWHMPDVKSMAWLGGTVVFTVLGYYLVILAMRTGELTFVAPFRYAALPAALVLGWVVLAEWPAPLTFVGSAIVVATGVYTLYREGRAKRRALAAKAGLPRAPGEC
ncbi:MAG: DMT family transporter [Rhodobacteraceae bacterium]|nr:DMT family transporter [Paracoccaceae bacterium]